MLFVFVVVLRHINGVNKATYSFAAISHNCVKTVLTARWLSLSSAK